MSHSWLILIISLLTHNATERMRVWRVLKALGCGVVLSGGVDLLPYRPKFQQAFEVQAEEVKAYGSMLIYLLLLDIENQEQQSLFEVLFDRSDDYAKQLEFLRQIGQALESEEYRSIGSFFACWRYSRAGSGRTGNTHRRDGMRQRWINDDELLAEIEKIFDPFYQAFSGNDS